MHLYKYQVEYYRKKVYDILVNDIGMILLKFKYGQRQSRPRRQIISALISRFIGLAYEGISSFLHHK